jgi:hypothetical protein
MYRVRRIALILLLLTVPRPVRGDAGETFFEVKIRPILAGTCFRCHGGKKTSASFRVDSRAAILKGGDSGEAVVPGNPDASLLFQAIRHSHESIKMPPDRQLPEDVVADFRRWIQEGAPWPADSKTAGKDAFASSRHWAFEPVKSTEPPDDPSGWSASPIDRFVAARRDRAGLGPVRQADKRTLIRRVSFDLIGLPPTPDEIHAFLADDSPAAYDRLVERLLASPHYGERWGRHWMDVIRYADTAGDNADYPVPELARYRDYIIDSFNRDKPFDQFVCEQLAGDLLNGPHESPEKYAENIVATGYLALSRRYATAPFELWHLTLEDTIDTTGRAFLGLTMRCARCHDHKFDPIAQKEYYALYGIFASTTFPFAGAEEFASKKIPRFNFVPTLTPDRAGPRLKAYHDRIDALDREVTDLEKQIKKPDLDSQHKKSLKRCVDSLRKDLDLLKRPGLPADLPGAYAVTEGRPIDVPLQRGGDPATPGAVVPRAVPSLACLAGTNPPAVPAGSSGRLELARWLTRPDHPLTARVMVNRIWQGHFGRGIVASASNFGMRGEEPTHPELLDWLAARFVAGGWSVKQIHRLIVTSKTYQLSSDFDDVSARKDPGNHLLWRFERRRLDAESIRDALLMVSGSLDRARPGPHPFPPISKWSWTQHNAFKERYPTKHRSVFLMTQRLVRHPYLATFDGPDTNTSTEIRTRSTVPLQALYLMNSPFVEAMAKSFADRLLATAADPDERIALAQEAAWGRPPGAEERERARRYIEAYAKEIGTTGLSTDQRLRAAWEGYAKTLLIANESLYID